MPWLLLLLAGLLEVVWAFTMKLSHGFTRPAASIITVVAMLASFGLLSVSMKTLPLGAAYRLDRNRCDRMVRGRHPVPRRVSVLRVAAALLLIAGLVLMKISA